MTDDYQPPEGAGGIPPGLAGLGGDALDDDDRRLLVSWRDGATLQDPRCEAKGLLALAALAMANPQLRARIVSDLAGVLHDLPAIARQLPEGVTVRFHENTSDTINVVLPPAAGEAHRRPVPLREVLRSRPTIVDSIYQDDFDLFFDDFDSTDTGLIDAIGLGGDPDFKDG